jgi:hypothetical protein
MKPTYQAVILNADGSAIKKTAFCSVSLKSENELIRPAIDAAGGIIL